MSDTKILGPVGYGLVGCGLFGRFCLEQYGTMADGKPIAVADMNPEAARTLAGDFEIDACESVEDLFARPEVELVHIATPPFTHTELVTKALSADKHVLCEKPLALNLDDAQSMIELASAKERVLSVNLIMRYDPLCEVVRQVVDEKLLGEPLHGFFENYAKDELLPPDHWFWDHKKSGGIFIEHGVHFFDLFASWLGEGKVVAAQEVVRPGANLVEQVQCVVRYAGGVLVNFYHGFTQAERMDRQEMRLVFERGTIQMFEWVPTEIRIDCLADQGTLKALQNFLPEAHVETLARYPDPQRHVTSRSKEYEVDGRYVITGDAGLAKPELYGHVLRALLSDQVAAIRDPSRVRRITEKNGYTSLHMAEEATRLARETSRC